MRTRAATRAPGQAEHLSFLHLVTGPDQDLGEVPVERTHAIAVIERDAVPEIAGGPGSDDGPGRGGPDGLPVRHPDVDPFVMLLRTVPRIIAHAELGVDGTP